MAPGAAAEPVQPYQYERLDDARQEIRLLTLVPGKWDDDIACSLSHASLADPDITYEALSYCWGSPGDTRPISLSGSTVQVTANLAAALRHLRQPKEPRVLWVDAVCINQADFDERAQQVKLMRAIYSTCSGVVIWLGEETPGSGAALTALGELPMFYDIFLPGGNTERSIGHLLTRPWFDRVWVIQEMALAKKGTFVVGKSTLDLEKLERSLVEGEEILTQQRRRGRAPAYFDRICRHMRTRRVAHLLSRRAGIGKLGCPFPDVFERHSDAQATDPRDNVFAFIGLAEACGMPDLTVSYHLSAAQVYANLVKRWIARYVQLDVITVYLERQERDATRVPDLPSWCPDYSGRSQPDPLNPNPPIPYNRDGCAFEAWTGYVPDNGAFLTSLKECGHQRWYIDVPWGTTPDEEMELVSSPEYGRFLTLDGCRVDTIATVYNPGTEIDDALALLADPLLKEEYERPEDIDSDEEVSIIDVIETKETFRKEVATVQRPWTHIFAASEPPGLLPGDDNADGKDGDKSEPLYAETGESKLSVFVKTMMGGFYGNYGNASDRDEERYARAQILGHLETQYRLHMAGDAKKGKAAEIDMEMDLNAKQHLTQLLAKRRFAVTGTGLFALVPKATRPGDEVVVLVGGTVPFVLRRKTAPEQEGGGEKQAPEQKPEQDGEKGLEERFDDAVALEASGGETGEGGTTDDGVDNKDAENDLSGRDDNKGTGLDDSAEKDKPDDPVGRGSSHNGAEEASGAGDGDSNGNDDEDDNNSADGPEASWAEANGPKYAGTSRGPGSLLLAKQRLYHLEDQMAVEYIVSRPKKVSDAEGGVYDPSWEMVGTAYVHGIMHGEVREKYRAGEAVLQTFLLV